LDDLAPTDFTLTHQYSIVPALVGRLTASGAKVLADHPDVQSVNLNREASELLGQSVPLIRADLARAHGILGTGIDIAVLDTGVAPSHADLAESIIGEACLTFNLDGELDESLCPGVPVGHPALDNNGHGTHVSGIITSDGDNSLAPPGVAPNANIFAYKVLPGTFAGVLAALDRVAELNLPPADDDLELVTMSLGDWRNHADGTCEQGAVLPDVPPGMIATLDTLRANGTPVFAASGNTHYKFGLNFPACVGSVISVGAVFDANFGAYDTCDQTTAADQVPCFSSSSPGLDLLAPGCRTLSTWPFSPLTSELCGTSMASPHAVASAALLLETQPSLTVDELESS
jgi:subtilisin family serine protease